MRSGTCFAATPSACRGVNGETGVPDCHQSEWARWEISVNEVRRWFRGTAPRQHQQQRNREWNGMAIDARPRPHASRKDGRMITPWQIICDLHATRCGRRRIRCVLGRTLPGRRSADGSAPAQKVSDGHLPSRAITARRWKSVSPASIAESAQSTSEIINSCTASQNGGCVYRR